MKKIINKIFAQLGYVPFDETKEIIYQTALRSRQIGEVVTTQLDFGDQIKVNWFSFKLGK